MDAQSTQFSWKLLHKFAPFRKRRSKQARLANALVENIPCEGEIVPSDQTPRNVNDETSPCSVIITRANNHKAGEREEPFGHRLLEGSTYTGTFCF
jgi:hypothetical protein